MFDLATANDFYSMLVQDFDEFMDEPSSARLAVHCAITAHHLVDWVWHDRIEANSELKSSLGVENLKAFSSWVHSNSVWMTFISEIANGTKHVKGRASFDSMRVVSIPFSFDTLQAGFDEGSWDSPVRYVQTSIPFGKDGKGYLVLDLGENAEEHRWLPAAHLLEVVVRFWRDFFRHYLHETSLPVSVHHAGF